MLSTRIARRVAGAGACVSVVGALAAPSALASQGFVYISQRADGTAQVSAGGASGAARLDISRGSTVIASESGMGWLDLNVASLVTGDIATLSAGGSQVGSFTYDGLPSINADACAGHSSFTGTHGEGQLYGGAYTPRAGTYDSSNEGTVSGGSAYTVTLARPLAVGDVAWAGLSRDTGALGVSESREVNVGACPTPPQPPVAPVTTTAPPTDQQVRQAVSTAVGKASSVLRRLDPADLASSKSAALPFAFPEPGTVKIELTAPAPKGKSASAAAAKKPVLVAVGTKTLGAAGSVPVKLKVTGAGRKLLRKAKTVKLTLKATFTPARTAKPQSTNKSVTLKHKTKKRKTKH